MRHIILTVALTVAAAPAAAQQLTMTFNQGLVTVDAANVPVRTILNEWAKLGGTKIVGSERVTGAPLTVKLVDVPEAKALEVILRSVAGYMAAPRSTGEGASVYDRIMVMATSSAPAPAPPSRLGPANPNAMSGTQRFIPPQRRVEEDAKEEQEEEDPNPPNPPVFTFPGAPNGQPGQFVQPQPGQQVIVNPQTGQTQTITIAPSAPPAYPVAAPFGGAPGSINVPPAPQPGQPGVIVRPPGRQ